MLAVEKRLISEKSYRFNEFNAIVREIGTNLIHCRHPGAIVTLRKSLKIEFQHQNVKRNVKC
tara:strand:+ start:3042 stop:3227 length:186 start_codon:yes stop_codon:yes gene_type:complete